MICVCVLGNLQGMRQVTCLWIECSPFRSGGSWSGCFVFVLNAVMWNMQSGKSSTRAHCAVLLLREK